MFQVHENDGLPKYSCIHCALDVDLALTIKERIIKSHKYLEEKLRKQSNPDESNQAPGKPLIKFPRIVLSHEPNKAAALKYAKLSIDRNFYDSQIPRKDITPKVEVEFEASGQRQNCNDASMAEKNRGDFVHKTRNKVNRKLPREQINYTCKVCNISFSKKTAYTLHCEKHKKTKCGICNKMIRSSNIKQHLIVHFSGPSVCNLCGITCKNAVSLRTHTFYQHRNLDAYVCEACGTKFNSRYRFFLHQARVHTGVRKFKCETCGRNFLTKHHLTEHDNMTHKKLRPHICEYCGTGFPSRKALKSHKRQHTDEKPYVCDHCDEGFRQRVSLRTHLKSKHGIEDAKESICSECGRAFATDFALSIHQRLHKSIKCVLCSESFAEEEYLCNHMKEAHGFDIVQEDEDQDTEELWTVVP